MGDDLSLQGRSSLRTPMQWSDSRNAGFSNHDGHTPKHPVIQDGPYGYTQVNICKQQREAGSLLNWLQRLIILRKRCPHIGLGTLQLITSPHPCMFIHALDMDGDRLLFIHNLGPATQSLAPAEIGAGGIIWIPLFSSDVSSLETNDLFEVEGYGYLWLRKDTAT